MRKMIALFGVALLSLAAAYGVTLAVQRGFGGSFDSARWKAAARNDDVLHHPRAAMLDSLERLLRVGMGRDEIEGLLGEPDGRDGNRRYR